MHLVKQAPYSPDLNQCDRWLFKLLKRGLRECEIVSAHDILKASLEILRQIRENRFVFELENLQQHCVKVISAHGDYVTM